jgi:hypothetical protein
MRHHSRPCRRYIRPSPPVSGTPSQSPASCPAAGYTPPRPHPPADAAGPAAAAGPDSGPDGDPDEADGGGRCSLADAGRAALWTSSGVQLDHACGACAL